MNDIKAFFITIDSNLSMFAEHIANRITQYSVNHVSAFGEKSSTDRTLDKVDKTMITVSVSDAVVCSSQPKTPTVTLKSVWNVDINNTCNNIKIPYNRSDIIIYDTPISYLYKIDGFVASDRNVQQKSKSVDADNDQNANTDDTVLLDLQNLETCSKRHRMSFIFIDARYDYDFIRKNLKRLHGQRCAVIVNKHQHVSKSLDLVADYLILLNENNVDDVHISKFIAFLVKSYQKFGNVLDVSLGKNNKTPMTVGTVVRCNIYDFITIPSNYCYGNIIYDCVQQRCLV